MYLLNVYSIFKVREVFALTNQLGNFFRFERTKFRFFQKIFRQLDYLLDKLNEREIMVIVNLAKSLLNSRKQK